MKETFVSTNKIINLITALSRIPGLRFLSKYKRHITTAVNVKKGISAFKEKDEKEAEDLKKEEVK